MKYKYLCGKVRCKSVTAVTIVKVGMPHIYFRLSRMVKLILGNWKSTPKSCYRHIFPLEVSVILFLLFVLPFWVGFYFIFQNKMKGERK